MTNIFEGKTFIAEDGTEVEYFGYVKCLSLKSKFQPKKSRMYFLNREGKIIAGIRCDDFHHTFKSVRRVVTTFDGLEWEYTEKDPKKIHEGVSYIKVSKYYDEYHVRKSRRLIRSVDLVPTYFDYYILKE